MINSKHFPVNEITLIRIVVLSLCVAMIVGRAAPATAEPRRVCIATLANLDAAGENYWLGHFIADSIYRNLSIVPELKVSLLTDMEAIQPAECPPDALFRVYGNFRDEGNTIAVSAYCVRNGTAARPAEASFVSSYADLYPHLVELAVSLAGFCGVDYSQAQLAQIRRAPTSSWKAIAFYGKGLCSSSFSAERGLWLLRAVSTDPSYTDALCR